MKTCCHDGFGCKRKEESHLSSLKNGRKGCTRMFCVEIYREHLSRKCTRATCDTFWMISQKTCRHFGENIQLSGPKHPAYVITKTFQVLGCLNRRPKCFGCLFSSNVFCFGACSDTRVDRSQPCSRQTPIGLALARCQCFHSIC